MSNKLMIVDDDEFVRIAVKELFELEGMQVVTAGGADECLKEIEGGFRGVILMDIMMPEKDGWDAIKAIIERKLYDGNIISMLTAKDRPDEKMMGLQEYVTDYITKPFESDELIGRVKEYFRFLELRKR